MARRILLLSPYDALSHRLWRSGLRRHLADHCWTVLTLPARHFNWRVRGNSLTWACRERSVLEQDHDLVVATALTDLAALRGLVPKLARVPCIVYFHENQFAYPLAEGQMPYLEPRLVNLYSALAADRVLFNSHYNRDSFLSGVDELLRRMPDAVPTCVRERLAARSEVLAVPIEPECFASPMRRSGEPLSVVWNHRWEYDKGPQTLLRTLELMVQRELRCIVHVVGQRFRRAPPEFDRIPDVLGDRLGRFGFVDRRRYLELLRHSHVVLSTAAHDFQGLAILEAVAGGCLPAVPDRLAYREFLPAEFRYPSHPDDPEREAQALAGHLAAMVHAHEDGRLPAAPDLGHLSWQRMSQRYRACIENVCMCGATHATPN